MAIAFVWRLALGLATRSGRAVPGWAILVCAMVVLQSMPWPVRDALAYDRAAIASGDVWRLATAHFVHLGWAHCALNLAGVAVAACLPGAPARPVLAFVLLAAGTGGLMWIAAPGVAGYRGASGAVYGFAAFALALRAQRDRVALAALLALAGWAASQLAFGVPLARDDWIGGPVVPQGHMAGVATGVGLALAVCCARMLGAVARPRVPLLSPSSSPSPSPLPSLSLSLSPWSRSWSWPFRTARTRGAPGVPGVTFARRAGFAGPEHTRWTGAHAPAQNSARMAVRSLTCGRTKPTSSQPTGETMSYLLLIVEPRGQRAARTRSEGEACYAQMVEFAEGLKRRGVLRAVESLVSDDRGKRVEVRGGATRLVDGPFAEAKEMVGGFFLLDVATEEEALAIAKACPAAEWCTVEVRETGPCFV